MAFGIFDPRAGVAAPQAGQGAFGAVPGPISVPSPYRDLASVYPNLSGTNQAVSDVLSSKLAGEVSPNTLNALRTAAAQWGVGSGMGPMSGLSTNSLFANIAGFSEKQQQEGLQDYTSLIPAVSQTQTVRPELQAEIAARNAEMAAAPDPAAAAQYALSLFDRYMNQQSGGTRPIAAGPSGISFGGGGGGSKSAWDTDTSTGTWYNPTNPPWSGPGAGRSLDVGGGGGVGGFGGGASSVGGFGGGSYTPRASIYAGPSGGEPVTAPYSGSVYMGSKEGEPGPSYDEWLKWLGEDTTGDASADDELALFATMGF